MHFINSQLFLFSEDFEVLLLYLGMILLYLSCEIISSFISLISIISLVISVGRRLKYICGFQIKYFFETCTSLTPRVLERATTLQ